jgi:hypothetical protein
MKISCNYIVMKRLSGLLSIEIHVKGDKDYEYCQLNETMTNSISHGKLKDEIHGCMDSKS